MSAQTELGNKIVSLVEDAIAIKRVTEEEAVAILATALGLVVRRMNDPLLLTHAMTHALYASRGDFDTTGDPNDK